MSKSIIELGNTTNSVLLNGETFTGKWTKCSDYPSIVVACKTDQSGILYVDFSSDLINTQSTLTYTVDANVNEVHRLSCSREYFRVRFLNNSGSNQTSFDLEVTLGEHGILSSPLNSIIQNDADAITVREIDFNFMTAQGYYLNLTNNLKDGYTPTIGNGAVTQDLWTESGAYTGFVSATAAAELVVAGADTGTVYYAYMATDTDLDYSFGSKAITGAGTYSLGHNIWRCNFMYFVSSSSTSFNAGKMTIRHTATPANIFVTIEANRSQSFCAAYTVPYLSNIYIDRWQGAVRGSTSGSCDGFIWYREYNSSPRYRFPFELQFGSFFFDDVDYLVKVPSRTDIIPRIINTSVNSLTAKFQYRLIKTK